MRFHNRNEAGRQLARALEAYKNTPVAVLALPRGGVVVGAEIAKSLNAPLDLVIARKVGHPLHPEYAICAVTEDGHLICNRDEIADLNPEWLRTAVLKEQAEAKRRREYYLANRSQVSARGKTVIITDDGVATGLTMFAAIKEARDRQPARVVLALPVVSRDIASQLQLYVDELVALDMPENFLGGVAAYYDEFNQVEDEEVIELLNRLEPAAKKKGE
jgi:predicted phosphoribosyltransferase